VRSGQLQAFVIGRGEQLILVTVAPSPDRADRVDDMLCRQLARGGNQGLPGGAATLLRPDESAFIRDRLTPNPVDRAGHTPTPPQPFICRVYENINLLNR